MRPLVLRESRFKGLCFLRGGEDLLEGAGKRGLEGFEFAGGGVGEGEEKGVEGQAAEGVGLRAVFFIAHDRTSDIGKMHPDLVLAAGLERDFHERIAAVLLQHAVMRHRRFGFRVRS